MLPPRLNSGLATQQGYKMYRPASPQIGIVHLGIGAFHRAHQAVYTDQYMAQSGDYNWFIAGVSLRSAGVRNQLADQDGLYTVDVSCAQERHSELVQSVAKVLVAPEDPQPSSIFWLQKRQK